MRGWMWVVLFGLTLALPTRADEHRGTWSAQGWSVEWFRTDDGGYCKATSPVQSRGDEWYQVSFSVGDGSDIRFKSTKPLVAASAAALEFPDGGGYDFSALTYGRDGERYTVTNTLSGSMVAKVMASLRERASITQFKMGDRAYYLPTASFGAVYDTLRMCERRRAGLLLDD